MHGDTGHGEICGPPAARSLTWGLAGQTIRAWTCQSPDGRQSNGAPKSADGAGGVGTALGGLAAMVELTTPSLPPCSNTGVEQQRGRGVERLSVRPDWLDLTVPVEGLAEAHALWVRAGLGPSTLARGFGRFGHVLLADTSRARLAC